LVVDGKDKTMSPDERLATVRTLLARYNAQDADAYVALMTEGASEANWRGAVVRDGREGVRSGLKAMFAEFPENRVEVLAEFVMGEKVVLHERVYRSATSEPFDVMVIYGFEGPLIDRVEFVR
jgi:hypothetical protein